MFLEKDDPFNLIRIVFVDIGSYKISKTISYISLVFQLCSFIFEINYLIRNYSLDLYIKYGCTVSIVGYESRYTEGL